MSSFKRGGFRSGGGASKKGYAKKRSAADDDDGVPRASKKAKGDEEEDEESNIAVPPKLEMDDERNPYISLNTSGRRRVTVSDFKGNTLVSIREYYINDVGELKPGKKGISLTIEQYNTLLASVPLLESVLAQKIIEVVRPAYDAQSSAKETGREEVIPDVTPDVTLDVTPEADEARVDKVEDDEE